MKTNELEAESPTLEDLLERADQESLLLRTTDGREFVLAEVDDLSVEIEQIRRNPDLVEFLDERSRSRASVSLSDARRLLGLT